jgi:hypothetical protein
MNNNKITKRDIIEGIGFILMVLSIVALMGALYQLREVNKEVKELRTILRK